MSILQGTYAPAPTSQPSGSNPNIICGKQGELLASEYHGKWYNAAQQGRVFHGSSASAGIAIPLFSATTQGLCLWNTSSNVNIELIKFSMGYISGTEVAGPIMYGFLNAGTTVATGAPIATFTNAPTYIRPAMPGGGASNVQFANVTVTTTAAIPAAQIIESSISGTAFAAATSTAPPFVCEEQFDGTLIVPPGWAFFPLALLATVTVWAQKIVWAEHPI